MRVVLVNWLCGIVVVVSAGFMSVSAVQAGELSCRVIQFKLQRFYFGAGEEQNIFAGSRFTVYSGRDSLLSGVVDQSYRGVSISEPIPVSPAQPDIDSLMAKVETAVIDSTSTIFLGGLDIEPASLLTGDSLPVHHTANGNPIDIALWRDSYQVIDQFEYGQADGLFSLRTLPWINTKVEIQATPAPFVAVIVPNLASPLNRDGYLTTSLYYRFGPISLAHVFNGEPPTPLNSFYLEDTSIVRSYPYDRQKGRQLLETMGRPATIRLSYLNRCLEPLADYFADILSRDRVHIEIEYGNPNADVLLELVPFRGSESVASMISIRDQIKQMRPSRPEQSEAITVLSNYIDAARDADSSRTRNYYADLADRSLKRDLGVFPLFRPTLYFISRDRLRNFTFDLTGRPRLDSISVVDLAVRRAVGHP